MTPTITVIFTAVFFAVTLFLCRGLRMNIRSLCVCGLTVAMTLVLELIYFPLPTGASIPLCSMVPLMLLALCCDFRLAFIGGWVCGVLVLLLVPEWRLVHWGQFFVEHMVCFSCLGYTGIFGNDTKWKVLCGSLLAAAIMLCGHLLSGVMFFSQNAWDGWGAWGYSLAYNLSQNVPLSLVCIAIVMVLPIKELSVSINGRK